MPNPLGSCVISNPNGSVPADLYENTGIVRSAEYAPFTKSLTVAGIVLVADNSVSDAFMNRVGSLIEEMFDENGAGIDQDKQAEVIRVMYERKTVIPLFKGEVNSSNFEQLEGRYSMCDVIYEFRNGDTEN